MSWSVNYIKPSTKSLNVKAAGRNSAAKTSDLPRKQRGERDYADQHDHTDDLLPKRQRRIAIPRRPDEIEDMLNEPTKRIH